MKKVISINFQGQVISIEESAYVVLQDYIDDIRRYFSQEYGGEEIVVDIECRIAELFSNRMKHGISCITESDVNNIIAGIGRPEDFDYDGVAADEASSFENDAAYGFSEPGGKTASANGEGQSRKSYERSERRSLYRNSNDKIIGGVCSGIAHFLRTDPIWIRLLFLLFFAVLFWVYLILWIVVKSKPLKSNISRRLYRNENDRVIAGVCGGIAAYFRIDSWIPRLLFLLPIIFNLLGIAVVSPLSWLALDKWNIDVRLNFSVIVLYLVLWILVPKARTLKQKLEMLGEEDYLRSIRETVNDNVAQAKNRSEQSAAGVADSSRATDHTTDSSKIENLAFAEAHYNSKPQRSGCLNVIIILLKIVGVGILGLFSLVLLALFFGFLAGALGLLPLKSLFIAPGVENGLFIAFLILTLAVPLIALVVWIVRRAKKFKVRPMIGVVALVLWLIGIVCGFILTVKVVKKYRVDAVEETSVISNISVDKLYVDMERHNGDLLYFDNSLLHDFFTELDLPYADAENALLFDNIYLDVVDSKDSLFHVRTFKVARGRNIRDAKSQIRKFDYNIVQKDSVIILPEFFKVPKAQGFRDQSITVEIAVPAGKNLEVSSELDRYERSKPSVVRRRVRRYEPINSEEVHKEKLEDKKSEDNDIVGV